MKRYRSRMLVALLIVSGGLAHAQERTPVRLLAGGWSYHLDRDRGYNEEHDMVGLAYGPWSVFRMTNSWYRESYGVGYDWTPLHYRIAPGLKLDLGAYGGLWTGYPGWDWGRPVAGARSRLTLGGRFAVSVSSAVAVTTLHLEFLLN